MVPREDKGIDLDNVVKKVIDGLAPIIGYRNTWEQGIRAGEKGAKDSSVVEIHAKKIKNAQSQPEEKVWIRVESLKHEPCVCEAE
jgi:hypothetical protein